MEDDYCTDCRRETEVVYDHKSGDTVCSECGLVLEARSVDEHSEWRTFADSTDDRDPTRVGSPVNPLLSHGGLSTIISRDNGGKGEVFLNRLQCRGTDPDRALVEAFGTIATMSDRSVKLQHPNRGFGVWLPRKYEWKTKEIGHFYDREELQILLLM